ncbi:MAG: hypothetical protein B6230_04290 [Desulfobacteraceae bacterium 4572_89]|nr:MAG: hypothetical protein B6230_04290 [Desulfobacteraceae bacterium 4572_89]
MMSLDYIDEMEPWVITHGRCPVCKKTATRFTSNTSGKQKCMNCFHKALETRLIREDISQWTWERFSLSLSSLGSMKDRLIALIHFSVFQSVERLPKLLVENLGFDSPHPLAWYARQKAYEASIYFQDSGKILKTILGLQKFISWQQKANMVKVCYGIDSSSPDVKLFITQMASDSSPNVRCHVADTIKDDKQAWVKTLFRKLCFDNNPLVREACRMVIKGNTAANGGRQGSGENRKLSRQPIKKQKPSYNRTEKFISMYCVFAMPKKIYEQYLSHIPDLLDKKKYKEKDLAALRINCEDSIIRLLAAVLSDKLLFKTVLERLPKQVVMLLYLLVWELRECDSQTAEKKLLQLMEIDSPDTVLDTSSETMARMPLFKAVKKNPAYFLFHIHENWAYGSRDNYTIAINPGLLALIEKIMPFPDFIRLVPVSDIKSRVKKVHKNNNDIFQQLPVILSFIDQGNLRLNKANTSILMSSLKKMANTCQINEYYKNGGKEFNYLKTKLLADFFNCMGPWEPKELENLPGFIKKRINQYFSFTEFESHRSRSAFTYIKHQMEYYDSDDDEMKMRKDLEEIFALLPKGEWISTNNLARMAYYNGIQFNPFAEDYEFDDLYISIKSDYSYRRMERKYVCHFSMYDIITLPFINTMMFFFGALGMVDLGYSYPENTICRQGDKSWLSIFDGLKYVRLTEFGNYILGRKKRFTVDIKIQSSKIEIDEHKTMLSMYGEDPIKKMVLEAVGQQINKSSYMVNYESFLKDCTTHKDVENKIQFFRDNIVEKPPIIWEGFFKEVLARMNPLEPVQVMAVFRVKQDRELLSILATDKILKKHVIKAENYHILVKTTDFSKVKKRLAFLGFFIR